MGNSFKLDDLLGGDTTETKPPRKKGADGYALDDLLGPDSATPPAPAGPPNYAGAPAPSGPSGPVSLGGGGSVAPTPAPAPRRGIGQRIGDWFNKTYNTPGAAAPPPPGSTFDAMPDLSGVGEPDLIEQETRTPAVIPDRRTGAQKLDQVKKRYAATISQRPDNTSVTPRGSVQGDAATAASSANVGEQERLRNNFTPQAWHDVARRGMAHASEMNARAVELQKTDPTAAEAMHQQAEDVSRKAYNAQLLGDGAKHADTFEAIALSNLLGIVKDPYAGYRANMNEIADKQATFTPEEQKADLGKNTPAPLRREFDLSDPRDTVAPLLGSLPVFIAGDGIVQAGARGLAELAAARGLTKTAGIAHAIGTAFEAEPMIGPRQAGWGGVKEAAAKIVADAPSNIARGATMGQVPGAILAARLAQQSGEDPTQAAVGSLIGNALMGPLAEMGFHAAGEFGRLAARTDLNIGRGFSPEYGLDRRVGVPLAEDAPHIAAAVEGARDVKGQTPNADKTVEGQHATIAKLLDSLLGEKGSEEGLANEVLAREATRPMVEPVEGIEGGLRARDENPPMRSAAEIAMERAGPADESNAVVQMERAKREAAIQQEQVARDVESSRIEQAAAQRQVEQRGPLPLGEAIMHATEAASQGEPLAAEYHTAINKFADAAAAMQDAGETPSERTKLTYARAKSALDHARKMYGAQAGMAAVAALASSSDDLTDDEKKMIGLGAVVGSVAMVKHIPEDLHGKLTSFITENHMPVGGDRHFSPTQWMQMFEEGGATTGQHYTDVHQALVREAGGDSSARLTGTQVIDAIDKLRPKAEEPETAVPLSTGLYSRLRRAAEPLALPGKKWDEPRPAADWIGKLKGGGAFSKAELTTILPDLEALAASKTKVSRDDVLQLIDNNTPQIERLVLEHDPAMHSRNGYRERPEIAPVEDLTGETRGRIAEQITARQERIEEIDTMISDRTDEARRDMEYADEEQQSARNEVKSTVARLAEATGEDFDDALQKALDHIDESVESDYVPRGTVDEAFDKFMEDNYVDTSDTPRDPEDQGIDITEDERGGVPEYSYEVNGTTYTAPTKWELLNQLAEAGEYDSGGEGSLLPEGYTITKEPVQAPWIMHRVDGGAADYNVGSMFRDTPEADAADTIARLHRYYGTDETTHSFFRDPNTPVADHWVLRRSEGGRILEESDAGRDEPHHREQVLHDYIRNTFSPKVSDSLLEEIKSDLERYARRQASYREAESNHYMFDNPQESGHWEEELGEKETLTEEIDKLTEMQQAAPLAHGEPATAVPGIDPYLEPMAVERTGDPKYNNTQAIGGGTNHRELLSVWANNKGEAYARNHYGEYPNVVGHVRVEDHVVETTPGLRGATVEYPEGEPAAAVAIRDQIKDVRRKTIAENDKLTAIVRAYEALPEAERDPSSPSEAAMEMARQYRDGNNNVVNLGNRETDLARQLRIEIGHNALPEKTAVMIESQSDWAQDANKYGVKEPPKPVDQEAVAAVQKQIDETEARWDAAREKVDEARSAKNDAAEVMDDLLRQKYEWLSNRDDESLYEKNRDARMMVNDFTSADFRYSPEDLDADGHRMVAENRARLVALDPAFGDLVDGVQQTYQEWRDARAAATAISDEQVQLHRQLEDLTGAATSRRGNQVPPSPFIETKMAHAINAARFLIDAAERGYERIAWSDSGNRIRKAHLPFMAARLTYDELIPSAMKTLLAGLGFKKVEVSKIFFRAEGHWTIELTPEMRKAIRKNGLPIMGVLAAMGVPTDADAQSTSGEHANESKKLYGTIAGSLAAGALIGAMATNRKLRSLVKENRELSRALLMDDLSGVASKKAHSLAIESVDRDPNTAWLAFDGDRFKTLNDTHGHPEGDKAIMHFGEALRAAARDLNVPLRAFRAGGDEFAFAVPKERATDVLRHVEEGSRYTQGDVTTKLTGSLGNTWGEADAMLRATKDANRAADPTLARGFTPDVSAKLNAAISDAIEKQGIRNDLTMEQYMALPPEERRKYIDAGLTDLKGGLSEIEVAQQRMQDEVRRKMDLYSNPIGPALAELRKYPSAAAVGLVGYAMGDSDNRDIQRAGVPVMALAALSAIGSDRIAAGADALGSRVVSALKKTGEGTNLVRFFNPDALLTPEVRDAIVQYEQDRAKGTARAIEFSGKAKKLGGEGDRAVSDVLDSEQWEDTNHFTGQQVTDVLSVAGELAAEYDRLTKEQLAAGTLKPSQVLPNYGGPRKYAFYDAMDALADSPRSSRGGGATPRISATKSRTLDIPVREAEAALAEAQATGDAAKIADAHSALGEARAIQMSQRVERGEIREASYRAAAGIEKAHNDVAAAKLFSTIRNVPGSAHPDWVSAVDEMMAAKDMARNATTPADKAAATVLQNEAAVKLDAVTRQYKQRGGEYVSLPDTPAMGVLRGAVVKRDIAHSLEGFGQPGTYGKMLRAWKEIKTVFNPGTSIGNILSNVTALHMGEVPVWLQPYYYTQAARDLKNYGEGTRALAEAGFLNVNSVNALGAGELGRGMRTEAGLEELLKTTRPETQKVLRENGIDEAHIRRKETTTRLKGAAAGAVVGGAKGYDDEDPSSLGVGAAVGAGAGALFFGAGANRVRRFYDNEDNIARLAVFLRRRKLGDTIEQARDKAVSSLGNFRSRSPALRMISSTVSPFVMYQAKAVPAFARNVVDHPWKYMTLMAAWGAMNELGKDEMGEVPETDIPVPDRKTYGYFFPGFTQLPFGNDKGEKAAVDMSRWTPMSGVTTGAPPGSVPEAFSDNGQALVTPGGPVIDAALRGSNVDPYTKGPMLHRDYPVSENAKVLANASADFVLPSALGVHASRLKADLDNGDFDKFKNDILGPMGVKPKYVRPGAVLQDASFTLERDLRDMKSSLVKELRANKDEDRKAMIVDRYKRRVGTALIKFKDRMGAPPDPAIVDQFFNSPDAGATPE